MYFIKAYTIQLSYSSIYIKYKVGIDVLPNYKLLLETKSEILSFSIFGVNQVYF